jgi:molybdenum-dependent DNA-binding transcriptional regulator ModE
VNYEELAAMLAEYDRLEKEAQRLFRVYLDSRKPSQQSVIESLESAEFKAYEEAQMQANSYYDSNLKPVK